jgi:hypothetical protein
MTVQAAAQALVTTLLACTLRGSGTNGASAETGPLALMLTMAQSGAGDDGDDGAGDGAVEAVYVPIWMALLKSADVPQVGGYCPREPCPIRVHTACSYQALYLNAHSQWPLPRWGMVYVCPRLLKAPSSSCST